MNTDKHESSPDMLEQATAELRSSRAASAPKPELLAATIRLLESNPLGSNAIQHELVTHQSPRAGQSSTRRSQMIKLIRWSSVTAASVLAAVILASFLSSRGTAFAQVIEKIKQAKSVTVRITQQAGAQGKTLSRCYMQGDHVRIELHSKADKQAALPDSVMIVDFKKLEMLELDLDDKKYTRNEGLNREAMKQFGSPLKWLAELTNENVELIGEEELDGQKVQAYRLKKIEYPLGVGKLDEQKTNRVWVDPKTGLPVKIVVNYFDTANNRNSEDVYDNFRWNEPIAEKLFSLAVPEGFKADAAGGAAVVPPFAQVLEKIKKAKSVTYIIKRKENPPQGRDPAESETKWYFIDGFERVETTDNKNRAITDYKLKQNLKLDFEKKTAQLRQITDAQAAISPMDDLRKLAESEAELLETTELDGEKVRVYRLNQVVFPRFGLRPGNKNHKSVDARVWVDAETNLPARITLDIVGHTQQVSAVFEKFTWNEPFDPNLFNLDIPQGFKLIESKPKGAGPAQ